MRLISAESLSDVFFRKNALRNEDRAVEKSFVACRIHAEITTVISVLRLLRITIFLSNF